MGSEMCIRDSPAIDPVGGAAPPEGFECGDLDQPACSGARFHSLADVQDAVMLAQIHDIREAALVCQCHNMHEHVTPLNYMVGAACCSMHVRDAVDLHLTVRV